MAIEAKYSMRLSLRAFWLRPSCFAASNSIQHSRIQRPRARTIRNSMCAIVPLGANRNRVHSEAALDREAWSRRWMRPFLPLEGARPAAGKYFGIPIDVGGGFATPSSLSPSRCVVGGQKKKKRKKRTPRKHNGASENDPRFLRHCDCNTLGNGSPSRFSSRAVTHGAACRRDKFHP